MKKAEHTWGPWGEKYNVWGEMIAAERRCTDQPGCGYQSASVPRLHEWLAMSKKQRRARR